MAGRCWSWNVAERRFYTEPSLVDLNNSILFLPEEETHHAVRVLRLVEGDEVSVIDGNYIYRGLIASTAGRKASVTIIDKRPAARSTPAVTLVQSVPKGKKADFIVEKSVELGVDRILFVKSERSVGEVSQKKLERWQKIAVAAAKQSKRDTVAKVQISDGLEIIEIGSRDAGFVLHPEAEQTLEAALPAEMKQADNLIIYIGPEGGFSKTEIDTLQTYHYLPVRLKTPVLRTETAPIAALSVLMFLAGRL